MYVHLSKDEETAIKVGKRHGKPVIYFVKAKQMHDDGYKFFISANGVCKTGKGVASHAKTFSGLLIYILNPAMILNAFLHTEFSTDVVERLGLFFVITLVTQLLFFFILYLIFRKKYSDPAYRIFTVGSVMGNVGFLGLPIITGVFPEESIVACYSTMYVMSMNLLVFTIGVYLITNDKRYISVKSAVLNPTTLSIFVPFLDRTMKISVLLLSAVPSGAVINSRAELHECEQEFSANVVLLTTIMCVVTIPMFSLVVQYLL